MAAYLSIGYEIAKVHKALKAQFQELLTPNGVTVHQFEVMRILKANAGITAAQLVERVISDSSTIMSVLKRLESKALITRSPDPTDRRTKRINLTAEGQTLTQTFTALAVRHNQQLQDCCSTEEFQGFINVLPKLYYYSKTGGACRHAGVD